MVLYNIEVKPYIYYFESFFIDIILIKNKRHIVL